MSSIVCDHGEGNPESRKYVSFEETKYVECYYAGKGFLLDPLCEVLYGDYQVSVLSCSRWEGSEEIHSPPSKRPRG
ncbi:hypothetical protein A2U01_0088207 [Trifolium medium]|uniref:Uncharacterized protein n=1 Tax=Trifolium medium TaxID=97028 RepID=A0A392U0R9_9FABA|nr:hypothetical protein [Trifolium medium]